MSSELETAVNKIVVDTVKEHLSSYLVQELFGWNSQLFKPMLQSAVSKMKNLPVILHEAMEEVVQEEGFKEKLKESLRNRIINDMVKSFNLYDKEMRNDPEMRKKIVVALQNLVK